MLFSAFAFSAYANEETTEKTDYYELTKNGEDTYTVDIYGNADLDILKSLSVVSVSFHGCTFQNLKKLPTNIKLRKMQFYNCTIENLDGIEKFILLSHLGFEDSVVKDISNVSKMKKLSYLGLCNMDVKDLSIIEELKNLKILNFNNCTFKDLTVIPNLDTLQQAEFFYCDMESIEGIERITSLKALYFSTVGIDDISCVAELYNLTDLAIEMTNVKDLSPIEGLTNLKTLDVDDCLRIESLDSIRKLENLEILWAKNCQMALSEETLEHLKRIGTKTDFTENDLQIKEQIIDIYRELNLDSKSDTEKIEIVTQYVVDTIKYDFDAANEWRLNSNNEVLGEYNNNALKYALQGNGCCRNYSALLTVLLLEADIDVYEIRNLEHIWNAVVLDGEFYWIDTIRIDEIDKGNVLGSPDYMTQTDKFFELHQPSSVPSSYYKQLNEQKEEIISNEDVDDELDTRPIIIFVIIILLILGIFFNVKRKNKLKEKA